MLFKDGQGITDWLTRCKGCDYRFINAVKKPRIQIHCPIAATSKSVIISLRYDLESVIPCLS